MPFQPNNQYGKTSSRKGVPNKASSEIRDLITNILITEFKDIESYKKELTKKEFADFVKALVPFGTARMTEVEQVLTIEQDNDTKVNGVPFQAWLNLLSPEGTKGDVKEAMEVYNMLTKKKDRE